MRKQVRPAHLVAEKMEAQRGWVTCAAPHSPKVGESFSPQSLLVRGCWAGGAACRQGVWGLSAWSPFYVGGAGEEK